MGARLSKDERRAVAQRVFAALCVHNPKHYVALIEPKLPAGSPERVLTLPLVPRQLCRVPTTAPVEDPRLVSPEFLKPIGRQLRITHRVLDVLVSPRVRSADGLNCSIFGGWCDHPHIAFPAISYSSHR